jgi:hypothetical protein
MSYSIIYDMKLIKDQNKWWLVLLSGDNNVYTVQWNGRQVRSRQWDAIGPFESKIELLDYTKRFKEEWDGGSIKSNKWQTYEKFYNKILKTIPESNSTMTIQAESNIMFAHRYYLWKNSYSEDKYKDIRGNFEQYVETMPRHLLLKDEAEGIKYKILDTFPTIEEKDLFKTVFVLSPELKRLER